MPARRCWRWRTRGRGSRRTCRTCSRASTRWRGPTAPRAGGWGWGSTWCGSWSRRTGARSPSPPPWALGRPSRCGCLWRERAASYARGTGRPGQRRGRRAGAMASPLILVVDDDGATATFLVTVLEDAGYAVLAATGEAALRLAREHTPALPGRPAHARDRRAGAGAAAACGPDDSGDPAGADDGGCARPDGDRRGGRRLVGQAVPPHDAL